METCLRLLLLLGVATAVATAQAQAQAQTQSQSQAGYEDAVTTAVDIFNQESGLPQAYRLLEAEPQSEWNPSSQAAQPLKFSVKETVCPIAQKGNLKQCDFKENGLVKDCSGLFTAGKKPPVTAVKCEDTSQEPELVTRRKFWKKVLNGALKIAPFLLG
ncbi:cathelicidin-related peptide Oh-Cath-like [Alligator sinensis]|uniref:Cathelicidin antimicrobial peptide CATH5 n=1 Tax=Alligator sinensis TaxID=38654 RepID=A0A1U7RV49_ALLSI|nr:cathelicidin-related peptide Oh-Cath-like [Alligator sinensis]ASN73765.1 cathelicidin antimicrobial peptide CATH5 precursor [Alligator sinensis]